MIVRASTDFVIRGFAEGMRAYGGMRRVVILTAVIVANVQHITRSAVQNWRYAGLADIPPDSERRPVSVKSLSESLGAPFETVRSNVNALIDEGLCVRVDGGVIAPTEALRSERVAASNAVLAQSFFEMIAHLKAIDFDFDAVAGRQDLDSALVVEAGFAGADRGDPPMRLIARVTAAFYLDAILAASIATEGDWTSFAVLGSLMSLNSEEMSRDRRAAWAYSRPDTPPPDAIRRPARIAEVAARAGIDKESARRHVQAGVTKGWVEKADGGYFVSMDHMQSPTGRRAAMEVTRTFYRMIQDLSRLGLRF